MKLALALGLLACCLTAQASRAEAIFVPAQGDFSVAIAMSPPQTSTAQSGDASRRYEATINGGQFELVVDAYPAGIPTPSPTKDIYQRLMWARAQETGGRMTAFRPVLMSKMPGWEATFRLPDGRRQTARVLMYGARIYQLTYTDEAEREADLSPVFDSFQLRRGEADTVRMIANHLT